ncbi:hypothetical protein OG874_20230 [Nocardia sp. NBC_00565]|uniref:hypothetical protein n=1 Tax=Nocardia sp. NBC_00565 TaxID=2975993 RepID=UPI002E801587|nr:hypothetical protein [Nocardia sp. NBC_00565]WUC07272.1 hypothetical protein OG874_20230 [Nocardia sp. NBC_00565]
MDHDEQGGDSIGAILSSLATTLREVSDKLDAVAAHVDDDRNLAGRLAKLEAWAFRTGEDVSKIGTRLEQVETGAPGDEQAEIASESPVVPATRERREPIPSRRDRLENVNGRGAHVDTTGRNATTGRNDEASTAHATGRNDRLSPATTRNETATGRSETTTGHNERLDPAHRNDRLKPVTGHNGRLETPVDTDSTPPRPARTEFTAPIARTEHLEPFGPATPNEPVSLPSRTPQPVPPAVPATYHGDPLAASSPRSEWLDSATPATPTYTNRLEPQPATTGDRLDYGTPGSSNGRLEPLTSPPRNGYESPAPRPDSGMTSPRTDDNGALPPGAHRATTGEDTSHVDKLQAMLDELKRNPNGPFGRPEPTTSANELPGVDPTFAIRTEG